MRTCNCWLSRSITWHFRFHPELLGVMATSCIMGVIVEVVLIKLGCYLLSIGSEMHVLDFFAFSGYKFCILIVGLCGGAFGKMIKYCVFGYCLLCYGFFLVWTRGDGKDGFSNTLCRFEAFVPCLCRRIQVRWC